MTFKGAPEQVAAARRFVGRALGDHPALRDLQVVTSELATNAIAHTSSGNGGTFAVAVLRINDRSAAVMVSDQGSPAVPSPADPGADAESGRGLLLVAALAVLWQSRDEPSGRSVVAVVAVP